MSLATHLIVKYLKQYGFNKPWLDKSNALKSLSHKRDRGIISNLEYTLLKQWCITGAITLKNFYPSDTMEETCKTLVDAPQTFYKRGDAFKYSPQLQQLANDVRLKQLLRLLLGRELWLYQSMVFKRVVREMPMLTSFI